VCAPRQDRPDAGRASLLWRTGAVQSPTPLIDLFASRSGSCSVLPIPMTPYAEGLTLVASCCRKQQIFTTALRLRSHPAFREYIQTGS